MFSAINALATRHTQFGYLVTMVRAGEDACSTAARVARADRF